jgi:hypothetical protein
MTFLYITTGTCETRLLTSVCAVLSASEREEGVATVEMVEQGFDCHCTYIEIVNNMMWFLIVIQCSVGLLCCRALTTSCSILMV